jgi:hypothetical protein
MYVRITIHLTGRGLKDPALRSASQSQHMVCTKYRGLSGLDRVCLIVNRRSRTSQIIDFIYLCPVRLAHIMTDNLEIVLAQQMPHILFASCIKVIEADNVIALFYQALTQMGTNKTCSTSN